MKPLVSTTRALRELATGLAPEAVAASAILFTLDTPAFEFLIAADDSESEQRVILVRSDNSVERYVPDNLAGFRRETLSRMASFAERARARGPLVLPRRWHQYKFNNLVAFFAIAGREDADSSRWIVEVLPGERSDVVFWRTTTSDQKTTLEVFEGTRQLEVLGGLDDAWLRAVGAGQQHFASARRRPGPDVEISLAALESSVTKGYSYNQWLEAMSADQKAFIESGTSNSIRLRGPAGSGKTLALTLKAVREVLGARDSGQALRVLVVTHSWALAAQISDSIDAMGLGAIDEIDTFPLLEVAQNLSPLHVDGLSGLSLIGEDSYSGKRAQLDEIQEVLDDFVAGDWITYRNSVGPALKARLDSTTAEARLALAWDLLVEFGSVIGAAAIFPGAGSEARYKRLPRAAWMLPVDGAGDMRVIFLLYCRYMESLDARSLVTSDQVLADFLNYLETHAWNRARKSLGYDLIFVDEFHLFNPLERQVIHFLTRDVESYPRVFMAVDPRQSPSGAFIGFAADGTRSTSSAQADDSLGEVASFELTTVHRFSPEILGLIKHLHHEFPTLDLGADWDIDFSAVESARRSGPKPLLVSNGSRAAEETELAEAVRQLYPSGLMALAVVDTRQWLRFSELASRIGGSGKYHVSTVSGRSDIEGLGYRSRGIVVGPAEYLAGLQFDSVLVAGIPDLQAGITAANERARILSLLYLAVSRAERQVRVFVNEDDGGAAEVLLRAAKKGLVVEAQGRPV